MVNRSAIAGVASVMMLIAAGSNPVAAQGACPAGCDGATNWTGFWVGGGIGANADMIGHDYFVTDTNTDTELNRGSDDGRGGAGLFGNIGIGYDWQVRDRFVIGAFTDFEFGRSEHVEEDSWPDGAGRKRVGWEIDHGTTWTIGARLGLLTSNTAMFYGLVGYSRANVDVTVFHNEVVDPTKNRRLSKELDFSGLVLGVGLEQNLGNGFSLKGEYRYTNYGSETFGPNAEVDTPTNSETDVFDLDSHSFRLTVAYKFGRSADVIEEVSYKDVAPAPSYTQPYK